MVTSFSSRSVFVFCNVSCLLFRVSLGSVVSQATSEGLSADGAPSYQGAAAAKGKAFFFLKKKKGGVPAAPVPADSTFGGGLALFFFSKKKGPVLFVEPNKIDEFTDEQIIGLASSYPVEKIPSNRNPLMSTLQVNQVYIYAATINRISVKSAIVGVHKLIRKGAANSGAPLSLGVEVYDPDSGRTVAFTKQELILCICKGEGCSKNDKNIICTFAETIAVVACTNPLPLPLRGKG